MATVASRRRGTGAAAPRFGRYARRLLAAGLYTAAAVVALAILSPVLPSLRPGSRDAAPAAIERPAGVPARIPEWAWHLHAWHRAPKSTRGQRPAVAPRSVPAWYRDWHEWRLRAGS